MEINSEVVATDGERILDLRLEVIRYEHTLDERAMGFVSGTFDLVQVGDDIEIRKQGGTPSAYETDTLESWKAGLATEGQRSFARHRFHVGDHYRPTSLEAASIGYDLAKPGTLQFIVTKADTTSLHFAVSFDGRAETSMDPAYRVTGTLELERDHQSRIDDAVLQFEGRPVGTLHAVTEWRTLPSR